MRGITSTNYNIQSLDDMKKDLIDWQNNLEKDINQFESLVKKLETDTWKNTSKFDKFRVCAMRCIKFLKTAHIDIKNINSEINNKITETQVKQLRHIGCIANELNQEIGIAKNQCNRGNLEQIESDLYCTLRDTVFDLIDLESLSTRLSDFVDEKELNLLNWNKKNAMWTKGNTIITLIGIIVSIVICIVTVIK